jgi:hypothetical protein
MKLRLIVSILLAGFFAAPLINSQPPPHVERTGVIFGVCYGFGKTEARAYAEARSKIPRKAQESRARFDKPGVWNRCTLYYRFSSPQQ